MKNFIIYLTITFLLSASQVFANCSLTGGACAIDDIIAQENKSKKQILIPKQNNEKFKEKKNNKKILPKYTQTKRDKT